MIFGKEYRAQSSLLCSLLHSPVTSCVLNVQPWIQYIIKLYIQGTRQIRTDMMQQQTEYNERQGMHSGSKVPGSNLSPKVDYVMSSSSVQ
jgi:hypothetical protein